MKSNNYEIVRLLDNSKNIDEFYFSPLSKTVVFKIHKTSSSVNDDLRFYYKLNNKAKLIDSLVTDNYDSYKILKKYLLSRENYISWIIDGDSTRYKYIELNPKADWTVEHTEKEFDKLIKKANAVYFFKAQTHNYNSDDVGQYFDKAVFLIDKKWYALYGKNLFTESTPAEPNEEETKIAPVYTHKLAKLNDDTWRLNAYYNLILRKDTLKLKTEFWTDRLELVYYHHPTDPEFCLLKNNYFFYMVKPKH